MDDNNTIDKTKIKWTENIGNALFEKVVIIFDGKEYVVHDQKRNEPFSEYEN